MPFIPTVSRGGLFARFILIFILVFILIIMFLGVVQNPLQVKGLLTASGQSFLSVPTSIIHGIVSLFTDLFQWMYTSITNLVVKPLQGVGNSISNFGNSVGNGIKSGLSGVGL